MKTLALLLAMTAALATPSESTQERSEQPTQHLYAAPCIVAETASGSDLVTVIDRQGEAWSFYGDGWNVGDECVCIFSDSSTPEIYDDLILDVQPAF